MKFIGICRFTLVQAFKIAEAWKINFHLEEQPGSIFISKTYYILAKKTPLNGWLGKSLFSNGENDIIMREGGFITLSVFNDCTI